MAISVTKCLFQMQKVIRGSQRVSIREFHVTMGATEWLFIMPSLVVMLHSQRVSICEFHVTMGATEWLFIIPSLVVMLRSHYDQLVCSGDGYGALS